MITSTSWQNGQSGNPEGRPPKGESITELINDYLKRKPINSEKTYKELFVAKLVDMAVVKGNLNAMKLIMSYVDHDYFVNTDEYYKSPPIPILSALSSV